MPHVKGGTPEQWDVVMEGMRATVTRGTGRGIQTKDYTIAGKTGTAQAYSVSKNQRLDRAVEESLRDPFLVHGLCTSRGSADRRRGAGGEWRLRRQRCRAHCAQDHGCLLLPRLKKAEAEKKTEAETAATPAEPAPETAEAPSP